MATWIGDDIDAEDVVLEPENNEPPKGGDAEKKVAKLKADLDAALAEKQEYMDGWQRAKADYVNLLKRFETEMKSSELKGKVKAVETLLPAFDALERSKEHGEVPEGFVGITKQLEGAFALLGLEEVGKVGEAFDPALHEAFGTDVAESAGTDDTITAVLEKGWKIGENSIRPAKVRVARYQAQA
jgi:molecular chaperone GrpE